MSVDRNLNAELSSAATSEEDLWLHPLDEDIIFHPTITNKFKRAEELEGAADKPKEIVKNLIRTKSLASILGPSKIGKSQLALQLAYCVQNGLKFLDYDTNKYDVIYVDFEHQDHEILERIEKLRSHFGFRGTSPYLLTLDGNDIYNEDSLIEICDQCRLFIQSHPTVKLVIFDSFSSFVPGDYNNPQIAKSYLDIIKYLSRDRRDIAVVYTQSASKPNVYTSEEVINCAGANGIHRKIADLTIAIAPKKENRDFYLISLLNGKKREVLAKFGTENQHVFDFKREEGINS